MVPVRVPLWFDEGYAVLAAKEYGRFAALRLNLAVATGKVPELRALDGALRGSADDAEAAYALAGSAVAELARRCKGGDLTRFLELLEQGIAFDDAVATATGYTTDRFEGVWLRSVRSRYNWFIWLATGGMWFVVTLVLVWAAASRRRREAPRRAALDAGWPVLGIVYDVTRDLMYYATKGEGCWLGTRRLMALSTPLNDASILMMTSNCIDAAGRCPGYAKLWLGQTNWKLRMIGSAALEATQVAAGIAHGALTLNGKLWDIAAPAALVIESGGVITDLKGNAIFPIDLTNYAGAKVPFLAAGIWAQAELLREIRVWP